MIHLLQAPPSLGKEVDKEWDEQKCKPPKHRSDNDRYFGTAGRTRSP